jgi:hypothetical protein
MIGILWCMCARRSCFGGTGGAMFMANDLASVKASTGLTGVQQQTRLMFIKFPKFIKSTESTEST